MMTALRETPPVRGAASRNPSLFAAIEFRLAGPQRMADGAYSTRSDSGSHFPAAFRTP